MYQVYTGTFDMIDPKTGRSGRHKTGVLHFSAAHLGNYKLREPKTGKY